MKNVYIKLIILALLLNCISIVKSQSCGDTINYSPFPYPSHVSEKTIRVAYHIFNKDEVINNFPESKML